MTCPQADTVDIFDTIQFKKEYEAFQVYYSGLELLLRFAIFIDKNNGVINIQKSKKTGKTLLVTGKKGRIIDKGWFDDASSTFEPRRLIELWYRHFNPKKERIEELIDKFMDRYTGYEDIIFNRLYRQYVDPGYKMKKLWFSADLRHRPDGEEESIGDFYARLLR